MLRRYEKWYSPAIGREVELLAYGHFGAPVIAFPSGGGRFYDFESNGMVEVLAPLIEAGKIKLYCPDGIDHESWLNRSADPHWKAVRHNDYQHYVIESLVPAIRHDCQSQHITLALTGCSFGAYHSANFALKYPHLFSYALCLSGIYDMYRVAGQTDSADFYYNAPLAYVGGLAGEPLSQIRQQTHITLVCGQGAWENNNKVETRRLGALLAQKGISHELDMWGEDVEHHWYWWKKQIVHHFGRRFG